MAKARQGGSGHTWFEWEGTLIAYAENVTVARQRGVAEAVAIQPLNAQRPLEIMTADALTYGTITMTLTQLDGREVWQRLKYLSDSNDLLDIFRTINELDISGGIKFRKVMKSRQGGTNNIFVETFYGCAVVDVGDDMPIDLRTMQVNQDMTIWYTHSIKDFVGRGGYKFADRDVRAGPV
jgi:hypothetical protein